MKPIYFMQFKDWLLKQETAGDSWGTPTAQPVLWLLRAQPEGAPLQGVFDLKDFPPGSIKNPFVQSLIKRLKKYYMKNKQPDEIQFQAEAFIRKRKDTVHLKMLKYFNKYRDKLPPAKLRGDSPDQETTQGFDDVGEPDTGQKANFKVLPSYT